MQKPSVTVEWNEDRIYFNEQVEPLLNTAEMQKIQLSKLRPTLNYFYDHVPFDRERMDKVT